MKALRVIHSCNANPYQLHNQHQLRETSVVKIHADKMPNALVLNVDVLPNIRVIHTKDVDQNVQQMPTVVLIVLVCEANV